MNEKGQGKGMFGGWGWLVVSVGLIYFIFVVVRQPGGIRLNGSTLWVLLMLACPLMHFWMMRGHGSQCHGQQHGLHGNGGQSPEPTVVPGQNNCHSEAQDDPAEASRGSDDPGKSDTSRGNQ